MNRKTLRRCVLKALILKIMIFCLNIVYFFFKPLKVKNKAVMISRQSNEVNDDFKLLGEALQKRGLEVVYLCKTLDGGVNSSLMTKISYGFNMFIQMYHLATSRVCILDSYSPVVSILNHKKSLKIVQIWHSIGTFKKFGKQILDKKEGTSSAIADVMKMHKNYDVFYCAGQAYAEALAQGFGADIQKCRIFTLPRVDLLKDEAYLNATRESIFAKYPQLKNKPNVVYAPTFRRDETDFGKYLNALINEFDFSKYNLVVKLHPLSEISIEDERVVFDKEFSTFQMLSCADKLVSDYSCVIYEAGIKGIPLYFYDFDIELYQNARGLVIDYSVLPGYKEKNAEKLVESFEKEYDYAYLQSFISGIIDNVDDCTEKMADDIVGILN